MLSENQQKLIRRFWFYIIIIIVEAKRYENQDFDCILSYYGIWNVKKVLNKISCAIGIYINLKYYELQLKIIKISCTIFTVTISVIVLFYYIKSNYICRSMKLYICT